MPELPDVTLYCERLTARLGGARMERIRLSSPFLLRSVDPPPSALSGRVLRQVRRLGKRLVWVFDEDFFLVLHLMIAGRLHWKEAGAKIPGRLGLAAFDFPDKGTVMLTEASKKKRASMHITRGEGSLAAFDRGGLEVLDATLEQFRDRLQRERHTLKRSLTDPTLFSGIGNAYSDELLHAAKLSPLRLTDSLREDEVLRLFDATRKTLVVWTEALRKETGEGFPEKVTAFREGMAVHGRYRQPCPVCGSPVQRIVYVENETNYCAVCQNQGRLLADRSLSRLLKDDWPKSPEELEELRSPRAEPPVRAPSTHGTSGDGAAAAAAKRSSRGGVQGAGISGHGVAGVSANSAKPRSSSRS
ncbi:MAG: Fpg/Nei family DNA glycosylase [Myxococcaceae bacterium]